MPQLGRGKKNPDDTAGAPFPAAVDHSDGPERPPHDVPSTDATADEPVGEEGEAEPEEEEPDDP